MLKNKLKYALLLLLAIITGGDIAKGEETAETLLKKAAATITNARGITSCFTMTSGNQKLSGTLKADGKKFSVETPASATWYDGKTMWTYNAHNKETTIMIPTAAEIAEANPLSIVHTYSNNFTAAYAKSQTKGSKTIVLTPRSKKLGYKSVHVTISDKNMYPTQLVVVPSSGQRITISITGIKTGATINESDFKYPKSRYPKAEIVDLR